MLMIIISFITEGGSAFCIGLLECTCRIDWLNLGDPPLFLTPPPLAPSEERGADLEPQAIRGCQGYGLSILRIRYPIPPCVLHVVVGRFAGLRIEGCLASTL